MMEQQYGEPPHSKTIPPFGRRTFSSSAATWSNGLVRTAAVSRLPDKRGTLTRAGTAGHIRPRGRALGRQTPPTSPSHPSLMYSPPLVLPRCALPSPPSPSHLRPLLRSLSFTPLPPPTSFSFSSGIESNYSWTQFFQLSTLLGSGRSFWEMKYLSQEKRTRASSNADNRRVPICHSGSFSGMGVNKDPQTNIDRVYVSWLHIFPRLSMALKTESWKKKKKGEHGSKEKC